VNFVNNVDFELRIGGRVSAGFPQFTDLFDAIVTRAVDFEDIERAALGDFFASRVVFLEINFRAAGTVQAFRENARDGRFPGATGATKEIRVRDALLLDCLGERFGNVLLADNLAESLRPIFSRYYLISHLDADCRMKNAESNQKSILHFEICILH
jgi:hypothetical protein